MGYTKGEWEVEDKTQVVSGDRLIANTGGYTNNFSSPLSENMANAKFIAAAPDMYEALKSIWEWSIDKERNSLDLAMNKVEIALTKAEGKPQ